MTSRTYRRCKGITRFGEQCKANSVAGEGECYCPLHLPNKNDPRRLAAIESNRERTKAYWAKVRAERAAMTCISGPVDTGKVAA